MSIKNTKESKRNSIHTQQMSYFKVRTPGFPLLISPFSAYWKCNKPSKFLIFNWTTCHRVITFPLHINHIDRKKITGVWLWVLQCDSTIMNVSKQDQVNFLLWKNWEVWPGFHIEVCGFFLIHSIFTDLINHGLWYSSSKQ